MDVSITSNNIFNIFPHSCIQILSTAIVTILYFFIII